MESKTNVMRILDQKKVPYQSHCYAQTDAVSGVEVAQVLGQNPDQVFKTLVTFGASGGNFVFVIPASGELDLKKAAKACGRKSIEMIPQKLLFPLTGYIHGGCSPIGMKKPLSGTFIDETAILYDYICVSAGKVGTNIGIHPEKLADFVNASFADLTR